MDELTYGALHYIPLLGPIGTDGDTDGDNIVQGWWYPPSLGVSSWSETLGVLRVNK
jgi:hypothetical protein